MTTDDLTVATTHSAHVFAPKGHATVLHPAAKHKSHTRQTAHFQVSYDPKLGAAGSQIADHLLQNCEQDFNTLQQYFGGITPAALPFRLIVTGGNSGASHASCEATTLMIGAHSGPAEFLRQLVIAEEDEVFEANFGHGWNCGFSNGEGLSRVLANDIVPNVEPDNFVSAPVWLDATPPSGRVRQNWVDHTDKTDVNYFSIGCSVLFLNWLRFQLKHSWADIIAAGAPTLAGTYQNLTGKTGAFADFEAVINQMFPPGQASGLKTDNPFV